jgi:hypothetical protein
MHVVRVAWLAAFNSVSCRCQLSSCQLAASHPMPAAPLPGTPCRCTSTLPLELGQVTCLRLLNLEGSDFYDFSLLE